MRKSLLSMLALAAVMLPAALSPAQESKPLAVISLSGYDGLIRDLGEIGKIAQRPGLGPMADAMVKMLTQGQGLVGVDQKQPWGAVVESDGAGFAIYAFVPVGEPKKLLDIIKPMVDDVQPQGDGFMIRASGQTLFLKSKGNWSYLSVNPGWLDKVQADPSTLLGKLPQQYVSAISLRIENIPKMYRDLLVGQLQMGMQMSMQNPAAGEDAAQFAARKQMADNAIKQLTQALDDLAHFTLGLNVDPTGRKLALEVTVAAKSGSNMARDIAAGGNYQTRFAGLLPTDAAFRLSAGGKLSANDIQNQTQALKSLRDQAAGQIDQLKGDLNDAQRTKLKQIAGDVFDVLEETTKSGVGDTAVSLLLDVKAATLLAGTRIANGAKLEKAVKDLIDLAAAENPKFRSYVKLDAATHQGVRFHTASIPIPQDVENRDKVVAMIGENLEAVVAVGDSGVYLALGRDPSARLKAALDKSKSAGQASLPPMQMSLAVAPVLGFAAQLDADAGAQLGPIAGMLAQSPGKDHVNMTATVSGTSVVVRLEVEEGIIKLLGLLPIPGGP